MNPVFIQLQKHRPSSGTRDMISVLASSILTVEPVVGCYCYTAVTLTEGRVLEVINSYEDVMRRLDTAEEIGQIHQKLQDTADDFLSFKSRVHQKLDEMGVPTYSREDPRVSHRLDFLRGLHKAAAHDLKVAAHWIERSAEEDAQPHADACRRVAAQLDPLTENGESNV